MLDITRTLANNPSAPQIGTLVGYMVAADLAYAGAIDMPSQEEIAEIVVLLMKGAVAGLWHLNLLPYPKGTGSPFKTLIRQQFVDLYDAVNGLLSNAEKEEMGWDVNRM